MKDLPEKMRVVELDGFGTPDVLTEAKRPLVHPAAGEVLIRVIATGVNGPDLVQRRGHYPPPKGASDLLGLEVSGQVAATAPDVTAWQPGDMVCALTNGGGYAEYVAVDAGHCLPIPAGVSPIDAAGLPETFFTVWSNVFLDHAIPENGNFLVHGGSGGIGSTAIQLGRAIGLNVFTTVADDEAAAFARALGAARTILYETEDFVPVCREAGGMDIILDIIGGDYVARNIKAARHDARIVQLAFNAGSRVDIDLMPMMLKRISYTGSTLRSRSDGFKARVAQSLRERVWPLFEAGALRSVTHTVLPLADAAEAHRMMESASHQGKILLTP
ncbi:NAD(P)H-quinone oxidoreductase [Brevirhabdus sp.]|uniref:NAD(P)H-quinone oxidoreductase n=1 Tax=Brevirhabdus sp. TaxID=2004514 RepID=UPI004058D503